VVDCPEVGAEQLGDVPDSAADQVTRELTALDNQIAEANARLVSSQGEGGPNFIQNAILGPLEDKRTAVLDRIELAFTRLGATAPDLSDLATCTLAD
jgi:hypothetical protein